MWLKASFEGPLRMRYHTALKALAKLGTRNTNKSVIFGTLLGVKFLITELIPGARPTAGA